MRRKVIIIGSGMAGLYLAGCLDSSIEVTLLCENDYFNSNSYLAKGGIAIPVSDTDALQHVHDTLIAGDGLCNPDVVEKIIGEGHGLISDLGFTGFVFDQSISHEGGHRSSRIRHVGDETGRYLMEHIWLHIQHKSNIRIQSGYAVTDLLYDGDRCNGVVAYNKLFHRLIHFYADAVVIAGGGCGSLYLRNTGNGFATGEMIALASRYGANIEGMEFMQFHPTMMYEKGMDNNMLITEALRGAGAILEDDRGSDIMCGVHPMGSLAPRDIVSRTLYRNMEERETPFVWLNYSKISIPEMKERFPSLLLTCIRNGFSTHKQIPVTPAAHYTCGGIVAGIDGQTSLKGLFAIGESASTGLHGANRLASNSLLELLVMARQSANTLNKNLEPFQSPSYREVKMNGEERDYHPKENQAVKNILWRHFGIVRNKPSMHNGLAKLQELKAQVSQYNNSIGLQRIKNRIECALLVAAAAAARTKSVGCHYVEDCRKNFRVYNTSSVSQSA